MSKAVATNVAPKKGNNTVYFIHCLIGIILMFGLGMLKPFDLITSVGMQVLGIFLGCIYLWSFAGILWPSLLGISDYAPMAAVIKTAFGDTVPV